MDRIFQSELIKILLLWRSSSQNRASATRLQHTHLKLCLFQTLLFTARNLIALAKLLNSLSLLFSPGWTEADLLLWESDAATKVRSASSRGSMQYQSPAAGDRTPSLQIEPGNCNNLPNGLQLKIQNRYLGKKSVIIAEACWKKYMWQEAENNTKHTSPL